MKTHRGDAEGGSPMGSTRGNAEKEEEERNRCQVMGAGLLVVGYRLSGLAIVLVLVVVLVPGCCPDGSGYVLTAQRVGIQSAKCRGQKANGGMKMAR